MREALYNALVHSRWSAGIPIQIRIEDDAMYISNECVFPSDWTMESLLQRHQSRPYNPKIARTFFRVGYIESWGLGAFGRQQAAQGIYLCIACHCHFWLRPLDTRLTFCRTVYIITLLLLRLTMEGLKTRKGYLLWKRRNFGKDLALALRYCCYSCAYVWLPLRLPNGRLM